MYTDIFYPKEILTEYINILNGRGDYKSEKYIDNLLAEFLSKTNNDEYLRKLYQAILDDSKLRECFALRLNYAALMSKCTDSIVVYTNPVRELLCKDNLVENKETGIMFVGDNPSELSVSDLDKKADEFYQNKEVYSSRSFGFDDEEKQKFVDFILALGYEPNMDMNAVHDALNAFLKVDVDVFITARVAYLAILPMVKNKEVKQLQFNPL